MTRRQVLRTVSVMNLSRCVLSSSFWSWRAPGGVSAVGALLCLALAACGSDVTTTATSGPTTTVSSATAPSTTTPPPAPSTAASSGTASTAEPSTPPADPVRERLDWLLGLINGGPPDMGTVSAGFAPSFLAAVPVTVLVTSVASAVEGGTQWRVDTPDGADPAPVIVSAEGSRLRVRLAVEPDGAHRITGLLLEPIVFPDGVRVDAELFDRTLRSLAPRVSFGLYDVTDGSCRLVHGIDAETPRPVGSAFKLWVLAALAEEIDAGRATWDETMPVSDALQSSSDGEIATMAAGTPVTLRRYAELMIAISDNSATDHLLHRIGRETVERAMRASGVADTERNVPMLSTRELFLLKWGRTLPASAYLAMDTAARRRALDTTLAGVGLVADGVATADTTRPAMIDEIEWFASPLDQCRTQLRLAELARRPGLEPVADILRANPGLPFDPAWTDVRFKGGSEAGVVFGSWRLTRNDGRTVVLAGGASDPAAPVPTLHAMSVVGRGIELLDG